MNLLDVLVPQIKYFFILISDIEKVGIEKYNSINIDFSPRIVIKNDRNQIFSNPTISYKIEMNDEQKRKLYKLFNNCPNSGLTKTIFSFIVLSENNYKFPVEITSIPNFLNKEKNKSFLNPRHKEINIKIKLENTNLSLFDDIETVYKEIKTEIHKFKKTTRFELMDI